LFKAYRIGVALAAVLLLAGGGALTANALIVRKAETQQAPTPEKIFNAETFKLDNGLEIVVIPNHRAPVVFHSVWYRVGAAEETPGKSGVAHFLEHLMFKGSEGLAPGEFSKKIRSLGGQDNAFTGHDYTAYHQAISKDYLETVMKMEAGRMRGLNPPESEVTSENKVILEERRQRTDNNPDARLAEQMNALMFINHPYAKPVIGWLSEMATLTWADEKPFYDKYYAPNNAILIVAGDVTGEEVYDLAKKIYGPLKPFDGITPRVHTISPPLKGKPDVTLSDPNIKEPVVQTGYRTPSAHENKKESLALEVLDEIMSGGPTSRIYKALVVDQKIATSAGLSYRGDAWDDAETWVYATPAPGQDLKTVKAALDEQLRVLVKSGVTPDELNAAITRMQTAAIYARDSLEGPAMTFGIALTTGSSVDDVEYWADNISKVTAQDVLDVAKKYLDPDAEYDQAPVTGYLVPEDPAQLTTSAKPHAPDEPATGETSQ
jgi:zinc protease